MEASELLNRITKAKRSQFPLRQYLRRVDPDLGRQVEGCGSWLQFREWIQTGDTRLLTANFCKRHLLCRACAVRRAGKLIESYAPKVEQVAAKHSKLIPVMFTFTVTNGFDLYERVEHLKSSWRKMGAARRKAQGSHRHSPIEWNKVVGSLRAFEVTWSDKHGWHPHFHVFALVSDWIDQEKLSAEWNRFTGDSFIVGVKLCENGIRKGLFEVIKYVTEFSHLTSEQLYEVYSTMKGARLIDPQGILRGVPEPDMDSDEIEDLEGPWRDFIARWNFAGQRYVLKFPGPLVVTRISGGSGGIIPPVGLGNAQIGANPRAAPVDILGSARDPAVPY